MSTRSSYRVIGTYVTKESKVKEYHLLNLYVQYDGYPSGHPLETMEWLSHGVVVNGITPSSESLIFNGVQDLAAQLVCRLKDGPGGTYIESLSSFGKCWEEYLYDIIVGTDNNITIKAYTNYKRKKKIFEGTPNDFIEKYKNTKE